MYIYGTLLEGEDSVTKTSFNGRTRKVEVTERYKIVLEKIVPAYMKNVISRVWVPGNQVFANDMLFEINSFRVDNQLRAQAGRMFLFDIDMTRDCNVDFGCTPAVVTENPVIVPAIPVTNCVECIPVTCVGP